MKKGGNATINEYNKREKELTEELMEAYAEINRVRYGTIAEQKPLNISKQHYEEIKILVSKSIENKIKVKNVVVEVENSDWENLPF